MSEPTLKASPGLLDAAAAAAALLGVLALAVLPLPAAALDLLLATAICLSMLVFLVAVYVERPLEFSAFPSLLLLITLFRLSLNIASTRIILLHGGSGAHAVGRVIQAFGQFAIGGNFVVGAVVFLILVIVNFVVITKGAERISEVAARFTLDSMPGKQMAVDADLGAGLINEGQARERRHDIECEADFHGAMDGAAKFVRGDAVAGLLIVGINVVGGMIVGVAQRGLSVGDAARTYTVLSVGEGLVSQIPALLVSTGAALLTTRASSSKSLGSSLGAQLFSRSRPMGVAAVALAALGLLPGMPHLAFLSLASVAGYLSFRSSRGQQAAAGTSGDGVRATAAADHGKPEGPEAQKKELEGLMPLDLLSLDVGLDLLPLVDAAQGGELLGRIGSLRKQLALELGFIVPAVHVRDDLRLRPTGYRICISGSKVAQGEVRQGRLLAIDPTGRATTGLAGDVVREPTFGLAAKWILPSDRLRAENAGCTVVDASTVIATHITEVVRRHAHELLGRRQAQEILDIAGHQDSKVVEELIPHLMSLGDVIKVLRNLLAEGVSVRDARTILETLADHAARVKDPGELTELVRQRLSRQISLAHAGDSGELCAMVLDPRAEDAFRTGGRGHDPQLLSRLTRAIEDAARQAMERDQSPLLVVAPDVRRAVAQVALRHVPGLTVLSYREIDPSIPFVTRGVVAAGAVPPVTASTQGARSDRKEMSP